MLDESINYIKKQINMYKILINNLEKETNTIAAQRAKKKHIEQLQILKYILKVLKTQK